MSKLFTAAKSFGNCIGKSFGVNSATGTVSCFVISGGPIIVKYLGFMVSTLFAGTNTLKFQFTVNGGSALDLCTAVDTDTLAVGQLMSVPGITTEALVLPSGATVGVGIGLLATIADDMPLMLSIGDIHAVWSASSTAGAGIVFMQYVPLSHYTKVQAQ